MDHKTAFRHLTKRVALDKETITYRLLSRELGIPVSEAKVILEAYLSDPQAIERGVSPTWALTGVLAPVAPSGTQEDAMEIDSEPPTPSASTGEATARRTTLLVPHADLDTQAALFTSSTRAVYSLSPCPLPSLSLLTAYALSSIPDSASSKWKSAEGGYGTIVHPEGPRKKVVDKKGKGKAVEPLRKASAPAALGKPKPKEKEKLKEKPKDRPMGERRGLFAKPAEPVVVPKKRKASPPPAKEKVVDKVVEKPKKKVSNGIFDDEVSEDEEDDEEQAMREMEAEAAKAEKKKVAAAAKAKASANMSGKTATKASGSGSASGSGAAAKGMTAAEKKAMAEKETKELEAMMMDDNWQDDMDVDDDEIQIIEPKKPVASSSKPPVKAATKPAPKPPAKAAPKELKKKPSEQASLNSFFKK